jgi:hypothetical protein
MRTSWGLREDFVESSWKVSLPDNTEFRSRGAMLDEPENALASAIYFDEQSSPADPDRIESFFPAESGEQRQHA